MAFQLTGIFLRIDKPNSVSRRENLSVERTILANLASERDDLLRNIRGSRLHRRFQQRNRITKHTEISSFEHLSSPICSTSNRFPVLFAHVMTSIMDAYDCKYFEFDVWRNITGCRTRLKYYTTYETFEGLSRILRRVFETGAVVSSNAKLSTAP